MRTSRTTCPPFSRRTAAWCVGVFVVLAFVLRLHGLGFSLPDNSPADERVWESQLMTFRGTPGPLAENYNLFYPDLVPRLCALVTPAVQPSRGCDPEVHRAAASRELLRLRFIVLLLSLLAIPATYRIARMVLGRTASVCAAGFAATSMLTQSLAQEARPHAAVGAMVAIALLFLCAARRRPDIGRWLLAGLACALAMSLLQSSLALIPAILVAAVFRAPSDSGRLRGWIGPAACLLVMSSALYFQPPLGDLAPERAADSSAVRLSGHLVLLDQFDGSGFGHLFVQIWAFDPLMLALSSLGLVRFLCAVVWRRCELSMKKDVIVVLGHAVPFGLVLGSYGLSWERFMMPVLPVAAVCAAAAVTSWTRVPGRIALSAAALLLAVQTAADLRYSTYRAAADTNLLAARWIEANVDPHAESLAKMTYLGIPVLCTRSSVESNSSAPLIAKLIWDHYLRRVPDEVLQQCGYELSTVDLPRDEFERRAVRRDADEFVAHIQARVVILQRIGRNQLFESIRARIAARGTLLARFSPRKDGGEFRQPPTIEPLAWTLLSLERGGGLIEIWRL